MSPSNFPPRTISGVVPRAPRALVVEDAQDWQELLVSELQSAGFLVEQASSGAEALEQVHRFRPDVIVLDLMLPGLNGFAVARVVRTLERGRHIVIIAVSALTAEPLRQEAVSAGCDAVLSKPLVAATVIEEAVVLMERRRTGAVASG
jgi:CheY-like chemotaxis protein